MWTWWEQWWNKNGVLSAAQIQGSLFLKYPVHSAHIFCVMCARFRVITGTLFGCACVYDISGACSVCVIANGEELKYLLFSQNTHPLLDSCERNTNEFTKYTLPAILIYWTKGKRQSVPSNINMYLWSWLHTKPFMTFHAGQHTVPCTSCGRCARGNWIVPLRLVF